VRHGDDDSGEPPAVVGRWFAEWFVVGHNAFEFIVDCGRDEVTGEMRTVYFRVIANPVSARELFRQLGAGLLRYADAHGPIEAGDDTPRREA
jgi:hypothetical protein